MYRSIFFALALPLLCGPSPLSAQQPLRPPQIAPFGDSEWWVLTASIPNRIGRSTEIITVPRGFVTDLASIPRFFWSAFPKTGPYMSAAILHDYLYWDQRCTRTQADEIFEIEMKSFGVASTSRAMIFAAVSELGGSSWDANAAAKSQGTLRYMPEVRLARFLSEPLDSAQSWPSLQAELARLALVSPPDTLERADENRQLSEVCARAIQANKEP
jgi:hypothetical protein